MRILREVTEQDLPEVDRDTLRAALVQWVADGVEHPMIPLHEDIDSDGTIDVFTLDDDGRLVFASGVRIEDTVSQSDGTGIEVDADIEVDDG